MAHRTLRVAEHLAACGHQPLVIAPAPARGAPGAAGPFPCPVVRLRSVPVPRYRNFRVAVPGPRLRSAVAGHRAELVHLASPFVLEAGRARLPTVAVYQTDMPGYARVYGTGRLGEAAACAALDPQCRRPYPRPVHGQRRKPPRERGRAGLGVGPRGGHPVVRSGQAERTAAP